MSAPDQINDALINTLTDSARDAYNHWRAGYGVISHGDMLCARVLRVALQLVNRKLQPNPETVFHHLAALDRLTSAGMWQVVHMTYTNRVCPQGKALAADDFKPTPDGHTGGALNMVPAYAAYLAANSLTGKTRSWLMGQGHCVAAIDALNV
ncbi:MAG TPA: xylulose 5-phosphate 3-epimerase, partial [Marinobacter sp.]|nr:xylulose 5-phosphate 3-epimerase [Marinobacter sp.]